jgi:hypothetical protein
LQLALLMMMATLLVHFHLPPDHRTQTPQRMRNQLIWLLLGAAVGAAEASRQSWAPPAFFNRFQVRGCCVGFGG